MIDSVFGYIGILAAIFSIISFAVNIYQWRKKKDMENMFHAHLFSTFNHMAKINEISEYTRREYGKAKKPNPIMQKMIRNTEQCVGITNSVQQNCLGLSERYLKRAVWRQKGNEPDPKMLKRAGIKS